MSPTFRSPPNSCSLAHTHTAQLIPPGPAIERHPSMECVSPIHACDWHSLQFLVLDEADRMIEKGHYEELETVLGRLPAPTETRPRPRQTFVFSATLTMKLAAKLGERAGDAHGFIGPGIPAPPHTGFPSFAHATRHPGSLPLSPSHLPLLHAHYLFPARTGASQAR